MRGKDSVRKRSTASQVKICSTFKKLINKSHKEKSQRCIFRERQTETHRNPY